jgi:hypothetical protein
MDCHESLMARRRKKSRATANAKINALTAKSNRNTFGYASPELPVDSSSLTNQLQQDPDASPAQSSKINDDADVDD